MSHWCPNCGAEYREGFGRCTDCDVALVETPPTPPHRHRHEHAVEGAFRPEDDTVELMSTNRLEAEVIVARLQSEGIPRLSSTTSRTAAVRC
jgi:predicted ATP-dependent serine protease